MTLQETWNRILQKLKEVPSFNRLFSGIDSWGVTFDESNNRITIRAPNTFLMEQFKDKHLGNAIQYAQGVSERKIFFKLEATPLEEQPKTTAVPPPPIRGNADNAHCSEQLCLFELKYYFEQFIAATSNQWALTVCKAIANWKCDKHNSLILLTGNTGTGKTHLLNAVVRKAREIRPNSRILYIDARSFVNKFAEANRSLSFGNKKEAEEKFVAFGNMFKKIQMLAIDDIDFFRGKVGSTAALRAIFDDVRNRGGIILVSSVLGLGQLTKNFGKEFADRLREFLEIEVGDPEPELLTAILKDEANSMKLSLDDKTLTVLAGSIESPRAISGILAKIKSYAESFKIAPEEAAQKLLWSGKIVPSTNVDLIKKAVAEEFGVEATDLSSNSRRKNVVAARDAAIYLCREILKISQGEIAAEFNRDRSMVSTIVIKVQKKMKEDPALADRIKRLRQQISKPQS